jgi:hypothetical protein
VQSSIDSYMRIAARKSHVESEQGPWKSMIYLRTSNVEPSSLRLLRGMKPDISEYLSWIT